MTKKSLSLINYVGHKTALLETIKENLPKNYDHFYDVFSGSCVVGLLLGGNNVTFVDNNPYLQSLYSNLCNPNFINTLEGLIKKYDLTNSSIKPRKEYLKDPKIGTVTWHGEKIKNLHLDQLNKPGYTKLLKDFNDNKIKGLEVPCAYMIAAIYGRNSYVTVKKGKLQGGVGPLDFSKKTKQKYHDHVKLMSNRNLNWITGNFNDISPKENDIVYMDPPYLASGYKYSGWTKDDEMSLLKWIDGLNCKWILSNVFVSGKKKNEILINWSKKYKVVECEKSYRKWAAKGSSTAKKENKKTLEVLIKNF